MTGRQFSAVVQITNVIRLNMRGTISGFKKIILINLTLTALMWWQLLTWQLFTRQTSTFEFKPNLVGCTDCAQEEWEFFFFFLLKYNRILNRQSSDHKLFL